MTTTGTLSHHQARVLGKPVARRPLFPGLLAGLRAYTAYRDLSAFSDAELSRRGLTRADLPRLAALKSGLISA